MYSDDAFRAALAEAISGLEDWARQARVNADIDIAQGSSYWRLSARPTMKGACPFDLLLAAGQTYSLKVAEEFYGDKPIDKFDLFLRLASAIEAGRVAQIETRNALTDSLECIESRVELDDGWAWIGERRIGNRPSRKLDTAQARRERRFLPYNR